MNTLTPTPPADVYSPTRKNILDFIRARARAKKDTRLQDIVEHFTIEKATDLRYEIQHKFPTSFAEVVQLQQTAGRVYGSTETTPRFAKCMAMIVHLIEDKHIYATSDRKSLVPKTLEK